MVKKSVTVETVISDEATVEKVGYTNDRQTVIYVIGDNDALGARFRMHVTSGPFMGYDPNYTRTLVGRRVEYTRTGVNDMRVPQGVEFVKFLPAVVQGQIVQDDSEVM